MHNMPGPSILDDKDPAYHELDDTRVLVQTMVVWHVMVAPDQVETALGKMAEHVNGLKSAHGHVLVKQNTIETFKGFEYDPGQGIGTYYLQCDQGRETCLNDGSAPVPARRDEDAIPTLEALMMLRFWVTRCIWSRTSC